MPLPESKLAGRTERSDIHLYVPPDAADVDTAPEAAAVHGETPEFLLLVAQRDADVMRIRAAIQADLDGPGRRVSERVLNLIRAFKEAWQDFRFDDLIAYDDVFEPSDHH